MVKGYWFVKLGASNRYPGLLFGEYITLGQNIGSCPSGFG